jgi:lipoate-protein ligase A
MKLKIIDTGKNFAKNNMEFDEKLLENLQKINKPILHFYDWHLNSITCGFFIKPEKFLNLKKIKEKKMEIAKRPTGGGIVFHFFDMAFSFLMPKTHKFFFLNSLKNYHFVNNIVKLALLECFNLKKEDLYLSNENPTSRTNFCMTSPSKYDLLFKGKKVLGSAERRKKGGYLHQSTISLILPDKNILKEIILPGSKILEGIFYSTYPLLKKGFDLKKTKKRLKDLLYKHFKRELEG